MIKVFSVEVLSLLARLLMYFEVSVCCTYMVIWHIHNNVYCVVTVYFVVYEQVGTNENKEEKKRKPAVHRKEESNAMKHFQDPVSAFVQLSSEELRMWSF